MKIYASQAATRDNELIYEGLNQIIIQVGQTELRLIERHGVLDIYADDLTIMPGAKNNISIVTSND